MGGAVLVSDGDPDAGGGAVNVVCGLARRLLTWAAAVMVAGAALVAVPVAASATDTLSAHITANQTVNINCGTAVVSGLSLSITPAAAADYGVAVELYGTDPSYIWSTSVLVDGAVVAGYPQASFAHPTTESDGYDVSATGGANLSAAAHTLTVQIEPRVGCSTLTLIRAALVAWPLAGGSSSGGSSGMTNPMTTAQDLIVGGTAGAPGRLGVGTAGQVLVVSGAGVVSWGAASSGSGILTAFSGSGLSTMQSLNSLGQIGVEGVWVLAGAVLAVCFALAFGPLINRT